MDDVQKSTLLLEIRILAAMPATENHIEILLNSFLRNTNPASVFFPLSCLYVWAQINK